MVVSDRITELIKNVQTNVLFISVWASLTRDPIKHWKTQNIKKQKKNGPPECILINTLNGRGVVFRSEEKLGAHGLLVAPAPPRDSDESKHSRGEGTGKDMNGRHGSEP